MSLWRNRLPPVAAHSELAAWLMPPAAQDEWLRLSAVLDALAHDDVPCRSSDAALWWPDARDLHSSGTRAAVAACGRCPACAECLAYALASGERSGVWGGTLPAERRSMR